MAQPVVDAPEIDEFEINLFGPGYGESIVVHLGDNQWLINDSCLDSSKTRPASLAYLAKIGIDPSEAVKLVIASHWHDDHIRGLSDTVDVCINAKFCCSSMLQSREFLQLVRPQRGNSLRLGSGLREFKRIIQILAARSKTADRPDIEWAAADKKIWQHPIRQDVAIFALSPSNNSLTHSLLEIGQLVDTLADSSRRVPSIEPNDTSVVGWVDFGVDRLLLGGDLEVTPSDDTRGWSAICDSTTRPPGQADVVKVAHHGSSNGNHPSINSNIATAMPISILTPFRRGRVTLPTATDQRRICSSSSRAYVTTPPNLKKKLPRDPAVERTLRSMGVEVGLVDPVCGHIQLRRTTEDSAWRVTLFPPAIDLCA